MVTAPPVKRTVAFFDGQNLFHHARAAFGYEYPNYSPPALANWICREHSLALCSVRFYTGIHTRRENPHWNQFWSRKLLAMSRAGVVTFSRQLRYRSKSIKLPGGNEFTHRVAEEKGIDVRIALDVIRMVRKNELDVVLLFSQDQDFTELVKEVKEMAAEQRRWIEVTCAYPFSPSAGNAKGIFGARWIPLDRQIYDSCIDPRDYRPRPTT